MKEFMPSTAYQPEKETQAEEKIFLGLTKDGANIYDRTDSHLHREGGLTPELLKEAIGVIDTKGRDFLIEQIDFQNPVGMQNCVEVGPEDEIVMVYRNRSGQTPMVKNREPEPCNSVLIILRRDFESQSDNDYRLVTGYIGKKAPREPWDPGISSEEELRQSENFWHTHALLYDEEQIDWEKTKALEFMSESAKKAELIRQKTLFAGIFIDSEDLYNRIHPTLEKTILNPHVTTSFKPDASQLHLEQIGSEARIWGIGYGNDGENEGLLVRVESEDPAIQQVCDDLDVPHITLSVSKKGQAKNTARLDFSPLETPIELTGKYGLFMQGKVIDDQNNLK